MEQIDTDLYRLKAGGRGVNVFLVLAEVLVLVDTWMPGHGPALLDELAGIGRTPELIVLTHGDLDHAGNADFLRERTGAQVCAAAAERGLLTGESVPLLRRLLGWLVARGQRPPAVDRWLEPDEVVGGLKVIPTHGHTPGHCSLVWGTTLFAGDAVLSGERLREPFRLFTVDRAEARRSIARLAELDCDLLLSGHGRPAYAARPRLQALVASWR